MWAKSENVDISKLRKSWRLIFGQIEVLVSTSYPENMSFRLPLSSKIDGFEIFDRVKKNVFFTESDSGRGEGFKKKKKKK